MLRPFAFAVPILTLLSSSAVAQPSVTPLLQPAPMVEAPEVVITSYRNEILVASALGVGAFLAGGLAEEPGGGDTEASDTLFAIGGIGMMFAPPVIHFAHGEYARGAGSLGLRWLGGSLGIAAAMAIHTCNSEQDWFCELDAIGPGLMVGVSVASLIDAFAMTEQRTYRPRRVLAPVFAASSDGGQLGLAGTF